MFDGQRVPLIGPQGIFKPALLREMPLSITTVPVVEGVCFVAGLCGGGQSRAGAHRSPTEPFTNAGRTSRAVCAKAMAHRAQFRAPQVSVGSPEGMALASVWTTTSGST